MKERNGVEDHNYYLPAFTVWPGGVRWPVHQTTGDKLSGEEGKHVDYVKDMLWKQRESESKARAAEIVARIRALHVDEMSPGTKVSFTKKFHSTHEYTYLALKVEKESGEQHWYVTGDCDYRTNERFEELLGERLGFENFELLWAHRQSSFSDEVTIDDSEMSVPG